MEKGGSAQRRECYRQSERAGRGNRMELQTAPAAFSTYIDLHLLVQAVVHDQAVSHSNPVWLHRMPRNIGIIAHVGIVKVGDSLLVGAGWCCKLHIRRSKRRHDE